MNRHASLAGSTILVVDDTPSNLKVLFACLNEAGYRIMVAEDGATALAQVKRVLPDLILLDIMMPGIDGLETCRQLKQNQATRHIPVIFLTSSTGTASKVEGFEAGGVDYITKPLQHEEVRARVNTHLTLKRLQQSLEAQNQELRREIEAYRRAQATVSYLNKELKNHQPIGKIFARSKAMQNALNIVRRVAATDSTVLIEGETGCGKQLLAHAIHNYSRRNGQALVKVDCASLRNELTENEFFGVETSAPDSTGLKTIGYLELAKESTLFLHEISELPAAFQTMLLRTIQRQKTGRSAGPDSPAPGIRIIASTKRNLWSLVEEGRFREDLYFCLNVIPLRVPALRERREDIPLLAAYFFHRNREKLDSQVTHIPDNTLAKLMDYGWPGNVRELENVIERALILAEHSTLEIDERIIPDRLYAPPETLEFSHPPPRAYTGTDVAAGSAGAETAAASPPAAADEAAAKLTGGKPADLSQDDFAAAVRSALQHFVETDSLQSNPLLFSNVINARLGAQANQGERTECLRALIMDATSSLARHPKTEIYARILHRTYYQPARSQEIAAESLGLGYSTFRRHLAKARSWLIAELWQREQCQSGSQ